MQYHLMAIKSLPDHRWDVLTDDKEAAEKVRKWSTQSRENAPWYQHEELGYNYRMSNVIAGVVEDRYHT